MYTFNSIKDLISALNKHRDLLTEMFEKRKISFRYDFGLELGEGGEDKMEFLKQQGIIRQNGDYISIDDQYLQFFEAVMEVNEEINTSYIHENIEQVKQNIVYFLQEDNESRRYAYLRTVKNVLRKIDRVILRSIIDLGRNIENTFKTEPNYKVKIAKLENYDAKRRNIEDLLRQTDLLITEKELTFFTNALDEELKQITTDLRLQIISAGHNLVEIERHIINYLNQVKYHSRIMEKLRQVKYLKDQFELKNKSNLVELLNRNRAVVFEKRPAYALKLSIDNLHNDDVYEIIKKVNQRRKSGVRLVLPVAGNIANEYLLTETEQEIAINMEELKNSFSASGNHLFSFLLEYKYPRQLEFDEKVTLFCRMVSFYEKEFEIHDEYNRIDGVEFALIYPK